MSFSIADLRPSTVEGANILFGTVDALFGTVDREGVGNEEGANLLLLPPLWSALAAAAVTVGLPEAARTNGMR